VKAVYEIPFLKPKQLEERLMIEANPNFAVLEKLITADSAAAT
jgi:hypothetical protein